MNANPSPAPEDFAGVQALYDETMADNARIHDLIYPHVYTTQEYGELLAVAGFRIRHVVDTTERFRLWQERSVDVRRALRDDIVATTSQDYFETSLALAAYEHDVSKKGLLGYAAVIAEAVS